MTQNTRLSQHDDVLTYSGDLQKKMQLMGMSMPEPPNSIRVKEEGKSDEPLADMQAQLRLLRAPKPKQLPARKGPGRQAMQAKVAAGDPDNMAVAEESRI